MGSSIRRLKEERAEKLRARAERAEAREDSPRLVRYLLVRAEDVLDTERRTRRIRPTSSRWFNGDRSLPPYAEEDEEDDLYRAGRSAENCLIRIVRRWKETNAPRIEAERVRRANPIRRNTRRGHNRPQPKIWDIIGT